MVTPASNYRIAVEDHNGKAGAVIWVKQSVSGPYASVDRPNPFMVFSWGFHSRHQSMADAEAIVRSLEYDAENPS